MRVCNASDSAHQSAFKHWLRFMLAHAGSARSKARLEAVRKPGAGIGRRAALHDRALRRLIREVPALDAADELPAMRELVGREGTETGEEQPAFAHAVVRREMLLARPRRLREEAGRDAISAVDADVGAGVELEAAVGIDVLTQAHQRIHRHAAESAVSFEMHAERGARIAVERPLLVGRLRADVEPAPHARVAPAASCAASAPASVISSASATTRVTRPQS